MRHVLPLLALACAIAGCTRDQATTPVDATKAPATRASASAGAGGDSGTRLTVYSGGYEALSAGGDPRADTLPGFALVDRTLHESLKRGRNQLSASGLPRTLDIEAATLRPESAGIGVLAQRYVAPPSNAADVLAAAVGRKVSVEHTSGGAKQTDAGTLVSAQGGLAVALGDGRVKVIREYDNFSIVGDDDEAAVPMQSALQWTVDAARAGDAVFRLSYPMGGMAWRAEYLATLAAGTPCTLDLDGAALVANRSGSGFDDVALTLVAGEPNRERRQPRVMAYAADEAVMAAPAPQSAMPVERRSGEYHAYVLPGRHQVANGSTERVPLFPRLQGVACTRAYETRPATAPWSPPQPLVDPGYNNDTGPQPVKATVSLRNDKASRLDRALPGGRVRVFEGQDFLGESMLAHTPKGADIRLEVGTVFDLTAERTRSDFKVDRAGRTMTESFRVTLKNAKTVDAVVVVVEPLPRWTDWTVVSSSVPAKKRDAQLAEFAVTVPAGGEAGLDYSVRYRWPAGVRP